jgi:hypothetical protein
MYRPSKVLSVLVNTYLEKASTLFDYCVISVRCEMYVRGVQFVFISCVGFLWN